MEFNQDLYNAAVVGENPEAAFLVEGKKLHAVEKSIAALKKSNPEAAIPLMQSALKALIKFANEKTVEIDLKSVSLKSTELQQLVDKILQIYQHLHHHDRNDLSSLIHHKAGAKKS